MRIERHASFSIRAIGSAALNLCLVAEGSCDAYFEYGIHIWDFGKVNDSNDDRSSLVFLRSGR